MGAALDNRPVVERFRNINSQLDSMEAEVNSRLETAVSQVNSLSAAIADLNEQIAHTSASGAMPNDLMDQRDALLQQLNEQIQVSTVTQDNGAVNVFIGNGQAIVHGFDSEELGVVHDEHQSGRLDLAYLGNGSTAVPITGSLGGGVIGGALDFRHDVLDPTRNEIGKVALAFVQTFNEQHHAGMDLNGNMGGDFFAVGGAQALPGSSNTGGAGMNVQVTDVGALTGQDYMFTFDGAAWSARDPATNLPVTFTGTGTALDPFVIDGVSIEVTGAAAAGDSFLVQPTAAVVGGMQLLITDPAQIAAAAPIRTEASLSNTGSATIDAGTVLDPSDPNLLSTVTITFVDANNYSVNGGPPQAYTSGSPIDVNGWRVQISGTPDAGDTFTVEANSGGTGDNRNALALASVQTMKVLDGATLTLESAYGDSRILKVADVEPFLGEAGGVPPWDLTDALDRGDTTKALLLLHRMMRAGDRHPLQVMAILHNHYTKLLTLDGADAGDEASVAAVLGIKPGFPARKALEQYRKLGNSGVVRAIGLLAQADLDLRGAKEWPDELVMEVLVARLSRLGSGRR